MIKEIFKPLCCFAELSIRSECGLPYLFLSDKTNQKSKKHQTIVNFDHRFNPLFGHTIQKMPDNPNYFLKISQKSEVWKTIENFRVGQFFLIG